LYDRIWLIYHQIYQIKYRCWRELRQKSGDLIYVFYAFMKISLFSIHVRYFGHLMILIKFIILSHWINYQQRIHDYNLVWTNYGYLSSNNNILFDDNKRSSYLQFLVLIQMMMMMMMLLMMMKMMMMTTTTRIILIMMTEWNMILKKESMKIVFSIQLNYWLTHFRK